MTIDSYAYVNKLRKLHPAEKILFSLAMLLVCLVSPSRLACGATLLIMALCTVLWAGVRFSYYLKLLCVPLVFLALSALPVLFEAGGASGAGTRRVLWDGGFASITQKSLDTTVSLCARAMGAVSCLYFLSLTTPMVDLLGQLRKWKLPALLIELMELIYRFLFVTLDVARSMIRAQEMRLGYRNLKTGLRSLGAGLAVLLSRSFARSKTIFSALECRLYDGVLSSLPARSERSLPHEAAFAALFVAAAALSLIR